VRLAFGKSCANAKRKQDAPLAVSAHRSENGQHHSGNAAQATSLIFRKEKEMKMRVLLTAIIAAAV
jgi:hypothetical protein